MAEAYIQNSVGYKLEVSSKIFGQKEDVKKNSLKNSNLATSCETCSGFSFENCQSVTINVYNDKK